MPKSISTVTLLICTGSAVLCNAQLCTSTHVTDLYCQLPSTFHTPAEPFSAFYTPFGTELSQLPIAKPAGLILVVEHGQLVPANENLGTIFSERPETVGKNRLLTTFNYQHFHFNSIDGTDLENVPIVLTCTTANCTSGIAGVTVYTVTTSRFDIKVNQYAILAEFGVTHNIDLSAAIPFERVALSVAVTGTEYSTQGATSPTFKEYVPGASRGIADAVLGGKWQVLDHEQTRVAAGLDVRIPSGDELNFLGSGTIGLKPYAAASFKGPVSVNLNAGYQWNGKSLLNANTQGEKQRLPTDLFYTAGFDTEFMNSRLTVIVDLLGQHYFNAPRLTPAGVYGESTIPAVSGALSVVPKPSTSYTVNSLAVGAKYRLLSHLILTGNATFRLNDAGLRSTVVPLVGATYTF